MPYTFNPFTGKLDYYQKGNLTELTATGTVDGINATFTFTSEPSYIVSDGAWLKLNNGWTWSTPTATLSVAPQYSIWGVQ